MSVQLSGGLTRAEKLRRAKAFERAVRARLRAVQLGGDAAVKAQLALLRGFRRDIADMLAGATEWRRMRLQDLMAEIDFHIEGYQGRAALLMRSQLGDAYEAGLALANDPLTAAGMGAWTAIPVISGELLPVMQEFSAYLIKGISEDMRQRIKSQVTLAVLGGKAPYEAMRGVDVILGTKATTGVSYRSERIVRTEMGRMQSAATQLRFEGLAKLLPQLKKQWMATHDDRTRRYPRDAFDHLAADGQVVDVDKPFIVSGEKLMYPGDPAGSPGNVINCLVPGMIVQGRIIGGLKAWYAGQVIELITAAGRNLTVTPNHPVLTPDGFVAAGQLEQGDYLLAYGGGVKHKRVMELDTTYHKEYGPARVEDVFAALESVWPITRRPITTNDLHGDAVRTDGYVSIVGPDRILLLNANAKLSQRIGQVLLEDENSDEALMACLGALQPLGNRTLASSHGFPGGSHLPVYSGRVFLDALPFELFSFGLASELDIRLSEATAQYIPAQARLPAELEHGFASLILADKFGEIGNGQPGPSDGDASRMEAVGQGMGADFILSRQLFERFPAQVFLDEVIEVRDRYYSGHVYDLQSDVGYIVAQDIFICNCRCRSAPLLEVPE